MKSYRLTNERFCRFKLDLDKLIEYYREKYSVKTERDWEKYEREYRNRVTTAVQELRPIIREATATLVGNVKHIGRPPKVSIEDKIILLLLKDIFDTSNRKTSRLLPLFDGLSKLSLTYKTIERLYSDPLISMALHNMFVSRFFFM